MKKKSDHKHVYEIIELNKKEWFTHEKVCIICGHVNNRIKVEETTDILKED